MMENAGIRNRMVEGSIDSSGNRSVIIILVFVFAMISSGCANNDRSDAYGQFEATETTISTEISGKLLRFQVDEGYQFEAGQQVGLVDTTRLILQRQELDSQLESIRARITNIEAEVAVQKENLQTAQDDLDRIESLKKDNAATQKELDDARARIRILRKQIQALQSQKQSIRADIKATRARISQVNDQIDDARILNPVSGTVLTSYAEAYEVVQMGQPLYRIANLDTMILRVYVSGAQLPDLKLGQEVTVMADKNAEENRELSGQISWIASEAEFTPKMIQTKEERVTQVYAVEVRVPNLDGLIKIGMPGEVNFSPGSN